MSVPAFGALEPKLTRPSSSPTLAPRSPQLLQCTPDTTRLPAPGKPFPARPREIPAHHPPVRSLLRIAKTKGNKQRGKFAKSEDLRRRFTNDAKRSWHLEMQE